MRALVQDRYGSPDVLRVDDVATPVPGHGEVLVRVRAASVNARDWHVMRGEPRLARLLDSATFGRAGPRVRIRGTDFAGTVESVGEGVTLWRPGDDVFGESDAAIAEYVAAPEGVVAKMPAGLSFEQAAAIPLAANTALVCLRAGQVEAGTERFDQRCVRRRRDVRHPVGEVHGSASDGCLQRPQCRTRALVGR